MLWIAADASGQVYRFGSGDSGTELGRVASARILEADGPRLFGRREIYRPTLPLAIRGRWIMVQDSLLGAVFEAPSGLVAGRDHFDGDFALGALEALHAVEIRSLAFNVWGELTDYLSVTVLDDHKGGESWTLHPQWNEAPHASEHRSSIVWIHRVMFDDGSILTADLEAVSFAWSEVSEVAIGDLGDAKPRKASQ